MTIVFYQKDATVYAVQYQTSENSLDVSKLEWLFSGAHKIQGDALKGYFIGPRREITAAALRVSSMAKTRISV